MRRERLQGLINRSVILLVLSLCTSPVCFADEFFPEEPEQNGPTQNGSTFVEPPPPRPVPDFAARAQIQAHFPQPTRRFSLFSSLTSFGAAPGERCMPEMFSPRGIGIARRTTPERLDYSPYVTEHNESSHGPSYYKPHHLLPCCQPHYCERRGCRFGWSVYY